MMESGTCALTVVTWLCQRVHVLLAHARSVLCAGRPSSSDLTNSLSGLIVGEHPFSGAKAVAQKALLLDETMAEPHSALGFGLQHFDFDLASAEIEFGLCIQYCSFAC